MTRGVISTAAYFDQNDLCPILQSGVGCYWGHMFAGALCYADNLVLLAPCASALRRMLSICSYYARDHGLLFNPCKTQLICFLSTKSCLFLPSIAFNNTVLTYSNEVIHLGHVLSFDLNDGPDILRVLKDLNYKANCVLSTFHFADCFLIKLYCLFLYGCCIWSLDLKHLNSLPIALKVMRKVYNLPLQSHVPAIVLSVSGVSCLLTLGAHAQRGLRYSSVSG